MKINEWKMENEYAIKNEIRQLLFIYGHEH